MDAAVVGVTGTLLGGLVGGLLTHWNSASQAKRQMRWQQVRLTQEKLEDIAQTLDQVDLQYTKLAGDIVLRNETGKPLENFGDRLPTARLKILIEFYAPELLQDWNQLSGLRGKFGEILAQAITNTPRTKTEKQEQNGKALVVQCKISTVCQSMGSKAAAFAQQLVMEQTSNSNTKR